MQIIYVPCPDLSTAQKIAETLLLEKQIACANILSPMMSFYWWEGKIEKSNEIPLILKTELIEGQWDRLEARLRQLHPYSVPCLLRLTPDLVNSDYRQWIRESLK